MWFSGHCVAEHESGEDQEDWTGQVLLLKRRCLGVKYHSFFSLSKERRFEEPIIRRNLQPAFNESFDLKLEEERWENIVRKI